MLRFPEPKDGGLLLCRRPVVIRGIYLSSLSPSPSLSLSIYFLSVLGFELSASHLLCRLHYLSHASSLFSLVILEIGSHVLPRLAWIVTILF
jgi:hypothetical protein